MSTNIHAHGAPKVYTKPRTKLQALTPVAVQYLTQARGLIADNLNAYRLQCAVNFGVTEIAVPFYDEKDNLQLVKFRGESGGMIKRKDPKGNFYEAKTLSEPGGKPILFGSHLCAPSEGWLVICFGDYDAMSAAQSGVPNCVSLPFGDKGFDFVETQWDFLEKFQGFILCPDNDNFPSEKARVQALKKLDELATRLGKAKTRLISLADYQGAKDFNELLLKKGEEAVFAAVNNAVWFPTGIVDLADDEDEDDEIGVPIGIPDVDASTNGLVDGDLIIMAGWDGAGKTTEAMNIAANYVERGLPVFLWSGEQKKKQLRYWFERVIAGPDKLAPVVMPETGFVKYLPTDADRKAMRDWYRGHVYQFLDVSVTPTQFWAAARIGIQRYGCRLVIIDNLMGFTGGEGDGYFQAQGDFAESCKKFGVEMGVAVILICHNKKVDEKKSNKLVLPDKNTIEGSKKITNCADIVIQMFRIPEVYRVDYSWANSIMRLCKSRNSGNLEDILMAYDIRSARFVQKSEEGQLNREFGWERKKRDARFLSEGRNNEI